MSNRNQPPFNPNQYPQQDAYGHYQQGGQPNQQPAYYASGPGVASYNYPIGQGGQETYAYNPAFLPTQGAPQGYPMIGDSMGQYVPALGTAQWTGGSAQHPIHDGYQTVYGSVDPTNPMALQNAPWTGAHPTGRSSTPHGQRVAHHPGQPISLAEGSVASSRGSRLDQTGSPSPKFQCPVCTSPHARKADLDRHIRSVHTLEAPYQCLGCNERFVRSDARGLHWKNYPACKAEHLRKEGN